MYNVFDVGRLTVPLRGLFIQRVLGKHKMALPAWLLLAEHCSKGPELHLLLVDVDTELWALVPVVRGHNLVEAVANHCNEQIQ